MDFSDIPSGRGSPRKELQGPRPAPLRVRKDSHKIRKPPMAPPAATAAASQPPHHHHAPPRPPVIIYTVSPKIIHANPNEFMSLVQRLTGPNNNYSASASSSSSAFAAAADGGEVSPAARFASIEKTKSPDGGRKQQYVSNLDDQNMGFFEGTDVQINTGQFPGILSPNPNSLPPLIPPNFFSLPSDNNYYNNNNPLNYYYDNSFILQPSPSTFISPRINTPSPNTLELFHSLFDM
ncbi:hypothetical protein ACP275_03G094600 [Erythranthe tilingii]